MANTHHMSLLTAWKSGELLGKREKGIFFNTISCSYKPIVVGMSD
jgi:hypothetical protein